MTAYLVIMMLTFSDGSVFAYNDGKWPEVDSLAKCEMLITYWVTEMRIKFANSKVKPSTFITGCAGKPTYHGGSQALS